MILPEVRREERRRFVFAAGAFMCVASAALVARTIGDTLYLTRFGSNRLALMYVGTAVIIAGLSFAYARFAAEWPVTRTIVVAAAFLVAGCVALRLGLMTRSGSLRVGAYFFAEIVIRLPALLFWTYATLIFNPREAKRMVGLIGAGGTLACILAGAIIPWYARLLGTANLLWLVAVLIVGFAIFVRECDAGMRGPRTAASSTATSGAGLGYYAALLRREQVRSFAALVFLATFALIVNDFVFKSTARAHFSGPNLAAFFGGFYSIASIAALVLQLFVVHQVLTRGGLGIALRVLPVALLVTSLGVVVTGSFETIVAAKFVEPLFDFTINAAALQMLYLGIAKQSRQQVRAFIDGTARPFAVAVAGGAILPATGLVSVRVMEGVVALVCCAWIWLGRRNYLAYTTGLSESIAARRFDVANDPASLGDPQIPAYIRSALKAAPDEELPYLLALTTQWRDHDWTPDYRLLLDRNNSEVRVRALEYLAQHGDDRDVARVTRELENTDAAVRRAAVRTVAALGAGGVAADVLWQRVREDRDPGVRAAAAAELIKHGGLDTLVTAANAFRSMVSSSDAAVRIAAAQAISIVGLEAAGSSLRTLLEDDVPNVRLAALETARSQPHESLVGIVVRLIRDPSVGWKAAQTLAAFGPIAENAVRDLVAEAREAEPPPRFAFLLPGMLSQMGPDGTALLADLVDASDLQLQHVAACSLCDVMHRDGSAGGGQIAEIIDREISRAQHATRMRDDLQGSGAELAVHALEDEYRLHVDALLHLLQLREPELQPFALMAALTSADRRAEALELLDNLVPPRWKPQVLALFESRHSGGSTPEAALRTLLEDRSSMWVTIAAIHAGGDLALSGLRPAIERAAARFNASAVTETAAAAMHKLDAAPQVQHAVHGPGVIKQVG